MTIDYARGKIYAIRSRSRLDLVYIGSTTQRLSERFACHKAQFRKHDQWISSFLVIEIGDSYIELIKNYPCASREELLRGEGQVQRSMPCVNVNIAGRTPAEWYRDKDYYACNREALIDYQKNYREANPEKALKNKADVKLRNATRYECICGCVPLRGARTMHERSSKHRQAAAVLEFIYS